MSKYISWAKHPVVGVLTLALALTAAGYSFTAGSTAVQQLGKVPTAEAATVDYFLKIDGIDGESTDNQHKGEIELNSFSWSKDSPGVKQEIQVSGGGAGAGRSSFFDVFFDARTSKASPQLMLACASGKHIPKVVLSVRKSGGSSPTFVKITLTDVLISSYHVGGQSGDVPTDQFSLNFAKIEFTVFPILSNGKLGSPVTSQWDVRENRASSLDVSPQDIPAQ